MGNKKMPGKLYDIQYKLDRFNDKIPDSVKIILLYGSLVLVGYIIVNYN